MSACVAATARHVAVLVCSVSNGILATTVHAEQCFHSHYNLSERSPKSIPYSNARACLLHVLPRAIMQPCQMRSYNYAITHTRCGRCAGVTCHIALQVSRYCTRTTSLVSAAVPDPVSANLLTRSTLYTTITAASLVLVRSAWCLLGLLGAGWFVLSASPCALAPRL